MKAVIATFLAGMVGWFMFEYLDLKNAPAQWVTPLVLWGIGSLTGFAFSGLLMAAARTSADLDSPPSHNALNPQVDNDRMSCSK